MTFYVRDPESEVTPLEVYWDGLSDRMRLVTLGFATLAFLLVGFCLLQAGLSLTQFIAHKWPAQFGAVAPWSPWVFGSSVAWNYFQTYYRAPSLPAIPLLLTMAGSGFVMHAHYL